MENFIIKDKTGMIISGFLNRDLATIKMLELNSARGGHFITPVEIETDTLFYCNIVGESLIIANEDQEEICEVDLKLTKCADGTVEELSTTIFGVSLNQLRLDDYLKRDIQNQVENLIGNLNRKA